MTELEKEFIYLSEIVFDDGKKDAIEEINESGGIIRVDEEETCFTYFGKDGSIFAFEINRLFEALAIKKLVIPADFPLEIEFSTFSECTSIRKKRIREYMQKLRSEIAAEPLGSVERAS